MDHQKTDNDTAITQIALTIIDLATSWFVITSFPNKERETLTIAFDQQWLCEYPRPLQILCAWNCKKSLPPMEFKQILQSLKIHKIMQ